MYYRSGTGGRSYIHFVFTVHSPGGSTFLHEMTSWPPSVKYDVRSKIRLCQLMRIYLKKKLHPDPNWNDRTLGFFEQVAPNKKNGDCRRIWRLSPKTGTVAVLGDCATNCRRTATIVAEFGDYSRQCGQGFSEKRDPQVLRPLTLFNSQTRIDERSPDARSISRLFSIG